MQVPTIIRGPPSDHASPEDIIPAQSVLAPPSIARPIPLSIKTCFDIIPISPSNASAPITVFRLSPYIPQKLILFPTLIFYVDSTLCSVHSLPEDFDIHPSTACSLFTLPIVLFAPLYLILCLFFTPSLSYLPSKLSYYGHKAHNNIPIPP
jgi:hypothetical protein